MMFVAGTPKRYLLKLGAASGFWRAVLADVLFAPPRLQIPMQDYQRQRLLVYFGANFAEANATPEQKADARRLQRKVRIKSGRR
jgi:hypothetical protein